MILVDTNVWSEATKKPANRRVIEWLAQNEARLALSPFVIAEIQSGIEKLADGRRRRELEVWRASLEQDFGPNMIAFDFAAAREYGRLVVARKLQKQETKLLDVLLAAQGIAHDVPVATRNLKDFEWTGVAVIDPWAD